MKEYFLKVGVEKVCPASLSWTHIWWVFTWSLSLTSADMAVRINTMLVQTEQHMKGGGTKGWLEKKIQPTSDIWSYICHLIYDIWYRTSDIRHLIADIIYLTSDSSILMKSISSKSSGVTTLVAETFTRVTWFNIARNTRLLEYSSCWNKSALKQQKLLK